MNEASELSGSVGSRLRTAREAQDRTLDDIGRATRVPVRHLVQIEEGRLEGLPAAPYSAGFVKSYARVVGLDPTVLSQEFRAEFDRAQHGNTRIAYAPYEPADPSRLPPRLLAIVALAIAIALIAGYGIWRSGILTGEGPGKRAQLAADGADTPAPTPAGSTRPATPRPAPAVPAANGPVVLTATAPVWLKVSERTGATLFIGTLDKGKAFQVSATAIDPVVRTGKPEGLAVTVGGQAVAPLGEPAHTISNVSLKPAALLGHGQPASASSSTASSSTVTPTTVSPPPPNDVPPAFANSVGR